MTAQSDKVRAELERQVAKVATALTLEIDRELRLEGSGTPVDTGHARANWVPSVGIPFKGEVSGEGAHANGVGEVLRFKLTDGYLYVANNVPYIRRLNLGHSRQAPAGFIEACVDRAQATIRQRYEVHIDVTKVTSE